MLQLYNNRSFVLGKEGEDRDQLTQPSSMASSGLGEGKGTVAGESAANGAEGETEGAGNSSGDIIRVNLGDGEGDEPR